MSSSMPRWVAIGRSSSYVAVATTATSVGTRCKAAWPVSNMVRSSSSSTNTPIFLALVCMRPKNSSSTPDKVPPSFRASTVDSITVMGVRSSCDAFAMNSFSVAVNLCSAVLSRTTSNARRTELSSPSTGAAQISRWRTGLKSVHALRTVDPACKHSPAASDTSITLTFAISG